MIWGAQRVGDVVMTLPALKLLKAHFPTANVTYVTSDYARDVVEISGMADRICALQFKGRLKDFWTYRRLRKQVKAGTFERILIFGKATRYEKHVGPLNETVRSDTLRSGHRAQRHAQAVMLAFGLAECPIPAVRLDLADAPGTDQRFASLGLDTRRQYVLLHPGRNRSMRQGQLDRSGRKGRPEKSWPIDRHAELAQKILTHFPEVTVAVVGTEGERKWVTKELVQPLGTPQNLLNLCGQTKIRELLQLLKNATVLVCADSGVMHLAGLVGTPTLALFGTTSEHISGPCLMNEKAVALRGLPRELARRDPHCMDKITVERVYEEAKRRLVGPEG